MRQVVLDTETTGLEPSEGHRIIEIGCVEIVNRRVSENRFHQYINPDREIDSGAIEVHGITNEMLANKPRFADVMADLLEFLQGAELIIHNAPFDTGFLNHEFALAGTGGKKSAKERLQRIQDFCTVTDTLALARKLHPGQKNDLDSLCRRYGVDNSSRTLHGALLDAEILADVYLVMTGGQTGLFEESRNATASGVVAQQIRRVAAGRAALPVVAPSAAELAAHSAWLEEIDKKSGGKCLWKQEAGD